MQQKISVIELFECQVKKKPGATALLQDKRGMSYRELDEASDRLANYLTRRGIKKGDFVGLTLDRSFDLVVAILAIIKTGAAYVPVDHTFPEERIEFILGDTKAAFLLTTASLAKSLPAMKSTQILLDAEAEQIAQASHKTAAVDIRPDDILYIIYTSGSTGTPKGVLVPHRGITRIAKHLPRHVDFNQQQTLMLEAQISFDLSVYELWTALLNGARLAIHSPEKPTPSSIVQAIHDYDLSVLTVTTGLYHLLIEERLQDLASLRCIYTGGDVMLPQLTEKATAALQNTTIINAYGPTENAIMATSYAIRPGEKFTGSIPIGTAVPGTELFVLDQQQKPVTQGQPGELVVGGEGVARGYLGRPELTREKFIANPFGTGTLYRTGDLVRELSSGDVEFLGRIDQQVKIRGFRIELGEIENTILKHAAVKLCAVTVQEDTPGDKRVIAHVVPRKIDAFKLSALKRFLAQQLPDYMLPAHYVVAASLPLNHSGKVDKKALHITDFARPDFGVAYEAPQTDVEKKLARLWQRFLHVHPVGRLDNFFDLGGNSMLAARVTVEMQRLMQTELSAGILYEHNTIATLSPHLVQQRSSVLDLQSEAQLDDSIRPQGEFNPTAYRQADVLLTGATGFLGAFLIRELIATHPHIKIHCLVRAANKTEGMRRIRHNLEKYSLWRDEYTTRLTPVAGHLDKPRLGLKPQTFRRLTNVIDTIYHNGAKVNYVQSYELHKPANVTGMQNILAFACTGKLKVVHFLSTAASFGPIGLLEDVQIIYENDNLDRSEFAVSKDMGYIQSKWVAEKILQQAQARGVPATILRPGFIMGDSTTGVNNTDDYVARLIKGCIQLGTYPSLPRQRKEFVPVDFVAKAIVHICSTPGSIGKAYNLVPPQQESTDMNDFFSAVRALFGYSLQQLPYQEWASQLAENADSDNALMPFLPLLTEKVYQGRALWELYENMSAYDSTNTQKALEGSGIHYPAFDEQLLRTYFSYMVNIGFLPEPPLRPEVTKGDATLSNVLQPELDATA